MRRYTYLVFMCLTTVAPKAFAASTCSEMFNSQQRAIRREKWKNGAEIKILLPALDQGCIGTCAFFARTRSLEYLQRSRPDGLKDLRLGTGWYEAASVIEVAKRSVRGNEIPINAIKPSSGGLDGVVLSSVEPSLVEHQFGIVPVEFDFKRNDLDSLMMGAQRIIQVWRQEKGNIPRGDFTVFAKAEEEVSRQLVELSERWGLSKDRVFVQEEQRFTAESFKEALVGREAWVELGPPGTKGSEPPIPVHSLSELARSYSFEFPWTTKAVASDPASLFRIMTETLEAKRPALVTLNGFRITAQQEVVPDPAQTKAHAVVLIGVQPTKNPDEVVVVMQNSWGNIHDSYGRIYCKGSDFLKVLTNLEIPLSPPD